VSVQPRKRPPSIRITVITVFALATIATASLAIGLQYYFGQATAKQSARQHYELAATGVALELRSIEKANASIIELLSGNPTLRDPLQRDVHIEILTRTMAENPLINGLYIGSSDGSYFEVTNLDATDVARDLLTALPSDRWLVITIEKTSEGFVREIKHLNRALKVRLVRTEATDFDASTRPWYTRAMESNVIQRTDPYLFAHLGVSGTTTAKRIGSSGTVVGMDIVLSSVSNLLEQHKLVGQGDIFLYDEKGQVLASTARRGQRQALPLASPLPMTDEERSYIASLPTLIVSNENDWPPFDYTQRGSPQGYSIDVIRMVADMTGLDIKFTNGLSWSELTEQFRGGQIDLLQSLLLTADNEPWGLAGEHYVELPYGIMTSEDTAAITSLDQLNGKTLAISKGWSVIPVVRKQFPEIEVVEVASTLAALEAVLNGEAFAAMDNEIILRYVAHHYFLRNLQLHSGFDFGTEDVPDKVHVMVQNDQPQLRAIISRAIRALTSAQLAYLNDTWLDLEEISEAQLSETVPTEKLIEMALDPAMHEQLVDFEVNGEDSLIYVAPPFKSSNASSNPVSPIFIGIIASTDATVAPFLEKVKLSILITVGILVLLLPFSWFFGTPIVKPIKQLAVQNNKVRRREYDLVEHVPSNIKELDELSSSMVDMVESIKTHIKAQRDLIDSFIKLIAGAIDRKSPYTAGHCARVPELALMLAERASNSDLPAFRDFRLNTEDQWREYRIAAWLHDCGKITTPEHIVDKGSKLEAINNRIHEVRMRFEVLRRDAVIAYWEGLQREPNRKAELEAELQCRQDELQADFTFIAECNVGGEFLDQDKQDRLRVIAGQTWQRYFDDRAGLSPVEELRMQDIPIAPLPATEPLLSDRPEHLFERTNSTDYPTEMGINMDIPTHLYNQGEIYNLSISRGTLTTEDRFKINEHMISTIEMLDSLPFPPELKNVPRWASTHHETMKGSGYPRKLPGERLSVPERILAVADVFEALTAADRPYKRAKPVSVAVDILHKMVLDNHIDRDSFELFLNEGVYKEYAERYLDPAQIDEVEVDRYLGESA